jgi:hypothetical protein
MKMMWCGAVLCVLLAGCSSTMDVRTVPVSVKSTALFSSQGKKLYLDKIVLPVTKEDNIGKRRTLAGRFWARIKSQSDLQAWATAQWRQFLARHRQMVVSKPELADYYVQCDITRLEVIKKYDWFWDDDFKADVAMRVRVRDARSGEVLRTQTLSKVVYKERAYDDNETISDDEMLNACLNTAFQEALEQLEMP